MRDGQDILIGIDAGTSVIKAVAFDLAGRQIAAASVPNRYMTQANGAATQSLSQTWTDCAQTLRNLGTKVDGLAQRVVAMAVTGQGDGTWLAGAAIVLTHLLDTALGVTPQVVALAGTISGPL